MPLIFNFERRKVVIFGGGPVGERKARLFSEYAPTIVVSKEFTPGLIESNRIKLVKIQGELTDSQISQHIRESFLVIPATNDPLLNERISNISRGENKLVDRVDAIGDIVVPSIIRRGDILVGISTLGHSPAVSKFLREKIEGIIRPEDVRMVRLQREVRNLLKKKVMDQKERQKILWNIMDDDEVWAGLRESYEKAYKLVCEKHI